MKISLGNSTLPNTQNNKVSGTNKGFNFTKTSFRGRPWELNPTTYGVPKQGDINAEQAIKLFDRLQVGNYLDIGNDSFEFELCNKIREDNLSFLDRVTHPMDKENFIDYYKQVTGFPFLNKTSQNIKQAFIDAVNQSEKELNGGKHEVILAGYDGVCSVGRGRAFPGSDLDKAYVIIKGGEDYYEDKEAVNRFKGKLWFNTDQRLLSYNHDEAAFPQVYTKAQIEGITQAIENKDIANRFFYSLKLGSHSAVAKEQFKTMYGPFHMFSLYHDDYVKANPYFIKYCQQFPNRISDTIFPNSPTREQVKNIGFTLEAIREGDHLIEKGSLNLKDKITYHAANLSQISALKQRGDTKEKRVNRINLENTFSKMELDKQFRFIKTLIESACANNRLFSQEFEQYFSKPGQDLFAKLIKALMG